jgi:hypothetical protein
VFVWASSFCDPKAAGKPKQTPTKVTTWILRKRTVWFVGIGLLNDEERVQGLSKIEFSTSNEDLLLGDSEPKLTGIK